MLSSELSGAGFFLETAAADLCPERRLARVLAKLEGECRSKAVLCLQVDRNKIKLHQDTQRRIPVNCMQTQEHRLIFCMQTNSLLRQYSPTGAINTHPTGAIDTHP